MIGIIEGLTEEGGSNFLNIHRLIGHRAPEMLVGEGVGANDVKGLPVRLCVLEELVSGATGDAAFDERRATLGFRVIKVMKTRTK